MRSNFKKKDLSICNKCYKKDVSKERPVMYLLEVIFETFLMIKEPVLITTQMIDEEILKVLEENFMIVTTEFPHDEMHDNVLILPLGSFQIKTKGCFFCKVLNV